MPARLYNLDVPVPEALTKSRALDLNCALHIQSERNGYQDDMQPDTRDVRCNLHSLWLRFGWGVNEQRGAVDPSWR